MILFYKLDGHDVVPCASRKAWYEWFCDADRSVGVTEVGPLVVSTVFVGLNTRFNGGPPIVFESVVFGKKYGSMDTAPLRQCLWSNKCSTWDEAQEMHKEAVAAAELILKERGDGIDSGMGQAE